jgi:hypothetical protein
MTYRVEFEARTREVFTSAVLSLVQGFGLGAGPILHVDVDDGEMRPK